MKQISCRFPISIHMLALIATNPCHCTGDFIAKKLNTHPVIVRKIMSQLKKAQLVRVRAGVGGATLLRDANDISLFDIYQAVEVIDDGKLFNVSNSAKLTCQAEISLKTAICKTLSIAQTAMEQQLKQVSLQQLIHSAHNPIAQ